MPTGIENLYAEGPNLGPHIRYFEKRARAKGAGERKAREWARQQVRRGRRAP